MEDTTIVLIVYGILIAITLVGFCLSIMCYLRLYSEPRHIFNPVDPIVASHFKLAEGETILLGWTDDVVLPAASVSTAGSVIKVYNRGSSDLSIVALDTNTLIQNGLYSDSNTNQTYLLPMGDLVEFEYDGLFTWVANASVPYTPHAPKAYSEYTLSTATIPANTTTNLTYGSLVRSYLFDAVSGGVLTIPIPGWYTITAVFNGASLPSTTTALVGNVVVNSTITKTAYASLDSVNHISAVSLASTEYYVAGDTIKFSTSVVATSGSGSVGGLISIVYESSL